MGRPRRRLTRDEIALDAARNQFANVQASQDSGTRSRHDWPRWPGGSDAVPDVAAGPRERAVSCRRHESARPDRPRAAVEKAFLVAVDTGEDPGWTAEESLDELAALAVTAGADVVGAEWQNRRHVDPNWYVGKGKAEELLQAKSETGFDMLVADDELSPAQQKALESLLKVKVIDRSRLILDIFAQHAQTHEGRLQVELAQLEYQLPRLTRLWTHLSRTGAASARGDPARPSWRRTGGSSASGSRR